MPWAEEAPRRPVYGADPDPSCKGYRRVVGHKRPSCGRHRETSHGPKLSYLLPNSWPALFPHNEVTKDKDGLWKGIKLASTRCKVGSWAGEEVLVEKLPRVQRDPRVSRKQQVSVKSPALGLCSDHISGLHLGKPWGGEGILHTVLTILPEV